MHVMTIPSMERLLERLKEKKEELADGDTAFDLGFKKAVGIVEEVYKELGEELFDKYAKEVDQKTEEYLKDPESHLDEEHHDRNLRKKSRDEGTEPEEQ